jgi:hypothetical protein
MKRALINTQDPPVFVADMAALEYVSPIKFEKNWFENQSRH